MLNTPSVTTIARACARGRRELLLELVQIEMAIDRFLGRSRQGNRIEDAVVVHLVTDGGGAFGDQRRKEANHRRIGRAEQHRGGAAMECGEAARSGVSLWT